MIWSHSWWALVWAVALGYVIGAYALRLIAVIVSTLARILS